MQVIRGVLVAEALILKEIGMKKNLEKVEFRIGKKDPKKFTHFYTDTKVSVKKYLQERVQVLSSGGGKTWQ